MSELETVWSGNSWRSFVPSSPMPMPTPYVAGGASKPPKPPSGRRKVLNALGPSWTSVMGIVGISGLSRRAVDVWICRLLQAGVIERQVIGSTKQGGQPQKLYRRRSTPEAV